MLNYSDKNVTIVKKFYSDKLVRMLKKETIKIENFTCHFLILLAFFSHILFLIKNKCLFVENDRYKKINFNQPENISIMNINCGNVVIELMPEISPNSVKI